MTKTQQSISHREELNRVDILFCGDSGDGIQILGDRFTYTCSVNGNDISSFPDFPAEIRAPTGTLAGVSGFKLCFSSQPVNAPGDRLDVMVAMNPAALKKNISELIDGGILIINTDSFTKKDYIKAGYLESPLISGELDKFRLVEVKLTTMTLESLSDMELSRKQRLLCKNMFALGMVCWLYERPLLAIKEWLEVKFKHIPNILAANIKVLQSGFNYAETIELLGAGFSVQTANLPVGLYRHISGNEALALGAVVASLKAKKDLFFAGYPITPSSEVLHLLSKYKNFNVTTFQSEDEIAAIGAAIGASYAGGLALTSTSGPGLDLKQEAIGLAVMAELPVVIFDIQRAGPSTGLPTKTEQADLEAAIHGRHGECDVIVLAAATPSDCFYMAIEAFRLAIKYMTPVILLSDSYIASSVEPWIVPNEKTIVDFDLPDDLAIKREEIYARTSKTLTKPWVIPGQPNLEYCLGGLEKDFLTGAISYEPENHKKMVETRREKINRVKDSIPRITLKEFPGGDLLIIGWGSTFGALKTVVDRLNDEGDSVHLLHLKYLFPFQEGLNQAITRYKRILVCEMNLGQLNNLIKSTFVVETETLQSLTGVPFKVEDIYNRCKSLLSQKSTRVVTDKL